VSTSVAVRTLPVAEIFGPTIQGEGIDQGLPVHFVRLGGCDYRCGWCDTPHAVLPEQVRAAERLTAETIVDRVVELGGAPRWVVLSGGNPALHDLSELVLRLQGAGYRVAVETQGSRWRDWLLHVDRLCISPKPPSSGMPARWDVLDAFLDRAEAGADDLTFLKVVVFDDGDYDYARELHAREAGLPLFLSAGNDAGATVAEPERVDARSPAQVREDLCARSLWLSERVIADPAMRDVRVQSQYHVLLWGNRRGV
jgi:7-carboxy-7-deazaguanine synthase